MSNEICPCPRCGSAMEDSQECQFCGYCEYEESKIPFWSKHLLEVDESYIAHGLTALSIAVMLVLSAIAQLVHAILPFVRPPLGTDVCSLIEYLEAKKPESRGECKEE